MRTAAGWLFGLVFFSLACSLTTPQTPATPTAVITPFPITPLPTATRNAGTPTPNPFASSPYDGCHDQRTYPPDFTLFPGETCADNQCVAAGLEADAYAAWKAEMMQVHQLTESSFAERIQLADVNANQSGNRVTVSIHFVVVNEWARTYQTNYMSFKEEPDAAMMAEEARMTVFEETQINLPQVATMEMIEATFAACDPALAINWCTLDYPNFGGRLHVTAFREVDVEADLCMDAAVYVDTGELWYCRERPCMIDE